jgi:hypothetical protein
MSEFPLCSSDDPRVPVAVDMLRKSIFMGGNITLDVRRILAAIDGMDAPESPADVQETTQ